MSIQTQTYHDILLSIKRGTYQGKLINAKPLLLLTVFESIDKGLVCDNKVFFSKELEDIYKEISCSYGCKVTPLFKPFYYLSYEEFWHLKWKTASYNEQHPSSKFIRDNIDYAYLDYALWDLIQDKDTRNYLRTSIEDYYLK